MLRRTKSKEQTSSFRAPSPSYMTKEQVAEYLSDLRSSRVPRPKGSRPLPSIGVPTRNAGFGPTLGQIPSIKTGGSLSRAPNASAEEDAAGSTLHANTVSHRRSLSVLGGLKPQSSSLGRPLVRLPTAKDAQGDWSSIPRAADLKPGLVYKESGQRWMERLEARSLRAALQDIDMQTEARLHAAAQAEASELVWRHQNHGLPDKDTQAPYKYTEHLQTASHHRRHTAADFPQMKPNSNSIGVSSRAGDSMSRNSQSMRRRDEGNSVSMVNDKSVPEPNQEDPTLKQHPRKGHQLWDSSSKKAYMNLAFSTITPRPRKSSGGKARKISAGSGHGVFSNPEDQIYEEPETDSNGSSHAKNPPIAVPEPLQVKARNSMGRVRGAVEKANRASLSGDSKGAYCDGIPPPQTRSPGYVMNESPAAAPIAEEESMIRHSEDSPRMKDGLEVRSEEIRNATSMRLKDRSPKLPSPTAVSDNHNRPIVSFDPNWQPKAESMAKEDMSGSQALIARMPKEPGGRPLPSPGKEATIKTSGPTCQLPLHAGPLRGSSSSSSESGPVIKIMDSSPTDQRASTSSITPSINIENAPTISVNQPSTSNGGGPSPLAESRSNARPLPTPGSKVSRHPLRRAPAGGAVASTPDRNLSLQRHTATCTQCGLGIAGRIVSAAGQRFHPECFLCYSCGEQLECVAFYPEPDSKRAERLARADQRSRGLDVEGVESQEGTENDDDDTSLRFYCHLDFHELFSPRCKSCKTPIEGEIVVACGAEWHVGHFFCAQCGDPFDASTPFVEKDGYAWCINCHTNRFSTKCKKCRKPVADMVLKALGGEWHPHCFCCTECGGAFDDGRYFLRGTSDAPVCFHCEEKRLKA